MLSPVTRRLTLSTLLTLTTLWASVPLSAQPLPTLARPGPPPAVRALGTVMDLPLEIPSVSGPSVPLWLLGEGDVLRGLCLAQTPSHPSAPRRVDLPQGVRVLGSAGLPGAVYILLESVATLDQPPGARGVVSVNLEGDVGLTDDEARIMARVSTVQELQRAVALLSARPAPSPMSHRLSERLEAQMQWLLRSRSTTPETFTRAISPSGLHHSIRHQGYLHSNGVHLSREAFAASAQAGSVIAAAWSARRMSCVFPRCEVGDFNITFERNPAGELFVREVSVPPARLPTPRDPAARREVQATASHRETDEALALRPELRGARVLAQSPLSARGGSIALVLSAPDATPRVAVTEERSVRLYEVPFSSRGESLGVRFLDADGDGRTELLIQISGLAPMPPSYVVVRAPRPTMQAQTLSVDNSLALAMLGAPDLDAAVRAALNVPARGVNPREACGLLRGSSTLARWRRVSSYDARVLTFEEPGLPSVRPNVFPNATLAHENVSGAGATCPHLVCSVDRPYCLGEWSSAGPGSQHYWFTWENSMLRVQGFADYAGS